MQTQLECFYLDGSKQNAADMLRKCVQDKDSLYDLNCQDDPYQQDKYGEIKDTARMNDISIQRGMVDYYIDDSNNYLRDNKKNPKNSDNPKYLFNSGVEGFKNYNKKTYYVPEGPGETNIPNGECPQGFGREDGKCIQKCQGCVYKDNMKSREFNEADPCFPEGTYNGITNDGFIKCTCGSNNQYCSDDFITDIFTAEGMMMSGKKMITNIGDTSLIEDLFNYDQL
jgi:hypothetical protein